MKPNNLSYDNLCNLISNEVYRSSPKTIDKYLRGIFRTILRQLKLNKRIYFKDFGTFEIRERKSGERLIYNPKTKRNEITYVKPKYVITFHPSSKFDYMVNENDFQLLKSSQTIEHNKTTKQQGFYTTSFLLNKVKTREETRNK